MLLTISYTGKDTTKLGYLLYKNPARPQCFTLNYGKAYVFYPEVSDEKTTAALLLDIDPIDLAKSRSDKNGFGELFEYVNDRPYVCSSFMSTAITKVFGTAMTGRADDHQELSDSKLDLEAKLTALPCRTDPARLREVFEPLGYEVRFEVLAAEETFGISEENVYVDLLLRGKVRLRDLLRHLYVLIPVFDNQKHYWVGEDEVDKLLRAAQDWLFLHPKKAYITGRYLNRKPSLISKAFERLSENLSPAEEAADRNRVEEESVPGEKPALKTLRLGAVLGVLKDCGAQSVIDIGCGEGHLLSLLVKERQFTKIAGTDVSHVALKRAHRRLHLDRAGDALLSRLQLFQGSLTYKDERFEGYDAACVIEVIEHLDMPRLSAFERVLFEAARPKLVILTTPNREYNANYEMPDSALRHTDHRFEWSREEFRSWAKETAEKYNYQIQFSEIGEPDEVHGSPTQMGVFTRCE